MMTELDTKGRRRRSGGRAGHASRRGTAVVEQAPWTLPVNLDRPTEPLSEDGVARIHAACMHILEHIGITFLHPDAVRILHAAGARVDGNVVRFDSAMVMEMIGRAPPGFSITPRNAGRRLDFGGRSLLFGAVASPPNYWDMALGRKVSGTRDQCRDLLRLTQSFNCIHFNSGYPVEPTDIHPSIRHLDVLQDMLTLTDKAVHAYCLGAERVEDAMEMVRLAAGLSEDAFVATPRMFTNINSTSPLKHDWPMLDGWMRMARRGQACVVTPFTLAGAMAPVTMAGAVAQSLAEGLAAIVLAQAIRPGCPCMIGTFTSNVDMRSGAPAFGTPEYMRATQMTGQLARFYGLPMRASGVCASNVPDGQAVWETEHSLWSAIQGGAHMVYHAAGWLEGGLIASPEKFVMDCEILGQLIRYMDPALTDASDESLALDAIAQVGPDGHFFGCDHTQARYASAFHRPFLSDWKNHEAWEAAGGVWTAERAHLLFKAIVSGFEPPAMEDTARGALDAFVIRRKEEGGAPTDF